jgi:hypothetical protein
MPGLWRTRVASFFAGSGLTALLAFGILRQDLQRQFGTLGQQVRSWECNINAAWLLSSLLYVSAAYI